MRSRSTTTKRTRTILGVLITPPRRRRRGVLRNALTVGDSVCGTVSGLLTAVTGLNGVITSKSGLQLAESLYRSKRTSINALLNRRRRIPSEDQRDDEGLGG